MRRFSDKYILKFILKKWSFGFTLISALFFISVNSWANSFYISPSGSDEKGNGSFAKPWQSLFRATSLVTSPGSIIHLMAGKYVEINTSILAPGVSIEGVGESSIILSAIKRDWASVILARSDEGTMGDQHISNLKFDGQNMTAFWAIWISGRSNVSIHNCVIVDFKDRGVIFDGRSDNTQGPPTIFAKGNSFHDNNVTNCAAYNTENGVYGRGSLNIGGQDGMLIYNNIITQDSRPDGYNGWPIKYSNDGYLKGVKIFKNTLIKKPFAGTFGGDNGWDFAIELWHVLGGVEIYDNTIQGSIDIVNAVKTTYNFSAWLHHNTISQKKLNSYFESGMVFEISNHESGFRT